MKEKETEYRKKIANYSPSTLRLLIRANNTVEQSLKKHEIVMKAKSEEEVVRKIKALIRDYIINEDKNNEESFVRKGRKT